jgi:predicted trehalose synthase
LTAVAFEAERWYADRGRSPVRVETLAALGALELVRVEFAEGEPALYTLLRSEPRWAELFAAADGAFVAEGDPPIGPQVALAVDQSHSSWRVGDAYVKCFRRLVRGVHPEVELGAVLGKALPEHVPRLRASLRWEDVAVAVVQDFVDGAEEGWEWAAARAESGDAEFAEAVGAVARRVHEALREEFPTRESTQADRAEWRRAAEAQLEEALPLVGDGAAQIRDELSVLAQDRPVTLTRVHGDLHVGQILHTPGRVVVIDFEGQPARSSRELDTPLRDLASLARSLDHCGRYAVEGHGGDPARVEPWIREARANLLRGYGPHDEALLRALEFDRAVYEFTYASRYLPEWLYAPRSGLRALLET